MQSLSDIYLDAFIH